MRLLCVVNVSGKHNLLIYLIVAPRLGMCSQVTGRLTVVNIVPAIPNRDRTLLVRSQKVSCTHIGLMFLFS